MELTNTYIYLNKYGNEVTSEMRTRLRNRGKYASGELYDSIRYEVKGSKHKFTVNFKMASYGQYVDKGTKPSKYADMPPRTGGKRKSKFIESLQKWCKIRGLPTGLAFPIRRKIWKFGLAPTHFFTIPIERSRQRLKTGTQRAYAKDIEQNISKDFGRKTKTQR